MKRVRLIAYSDYLCPWCFNAAVRLHRLEDEMGKLLEVEWRSFLLRPQPRPGRSLEEFRVYTQSWLRPAQDSDAGTFRVWSTDEGPPSHSVPPHLVAKAAAELGPQPFREIHERLLRAYFSDNRDITSRSTLAAIWAEAGLPAEELARADAPRVLDTVLAQHNEAVELGITGVPAVRMVDQTAFVTGAALPANSTDAPRYAAKRRRLLGVSGEYLDSEPDFRSSRVGVVFSRAVSRELADWRAKPTGAQPYETDRRWVEKVLVAA